LLCPCYTHRSAVETIPFVDCDRGITVFCGDDLDRGGVKAGVLIASEQQFSRYSLDVGVVTLGVIGEQKIWFSEECRSELFVGESVIALKPKSIPVLRWLLGDTSSGQNGKRGRHQQRANMPSA